MAAKIVDLDQDVEGKVCEIYGLSIDIGGFFKGDMLRASFQSYAYKFSDFFDNRYGNASKLQSVLQNVHFYQKSTESRVVGLFKKNIRNNRQLSICFNVEMIGDRPAFNYSYARIVGSIGLAGRNAPPFFIFGRLLRNFAGTNLVSQAPFTVDEKKSKIYIDLGNSLAVARDGKVLAAVGPLALGYFDGNPDDGVKSCLDKINWISKIYYNDNGGYFFTAGINVIDIVKDKIKDVYQKKQFVLAKVRGCIFNLII